MTSIAILMFCIMQGYWLYKQYIYTLQQHEDNLYEQILQIAALDAEQRKEMPSEVYISTQSEIKATQGMQAESTIEWAFESYVIDILKFKIEHPISFQDISTRYNTGQSEGIERYEFRVNSRKGEQIVYDALQRFYVDKSCPFTMERFDSLLRCNGFIAEKMTLLHADSMIWTPTKIGHTSLWRPKMTIIYPYNIFQGKLIQIIYPIRISPVIVQMTGILIGVFVLSLLLIFCLLYQTMTIFKQRRLEQLRRDFIHTMIHELKRPITTLKFCVSFMRDEQLMRDEQMKADILRNSCNELDNLTGYFSKLRDITRNDFDEIPLNLSAFSLRAAIVECIEKLNIPSDKNAELKIVPDNDIMITADKMHLQNILCNLLENAVKYSHSNVLIKVDYTIATDRKCRITVTDNGFGIPPAECNHVFDRFFRGRNIVDTDIPGMGLGLAYVNMLVKAHNGMITLRSKVGTGCVFTIELPQ